MAALGTCDSVALVLPCYFLSNQRAQLIPDFQSSSANNAINQFNAQLPAFIQGKSTAQSQLITVNQNTGVTSGDTQEGLHTNSSGDQKLAQKWFDALAPLI